MIRKIGKKGREWIRERAKLIKEAIASGRIQIIRSEIQGKCEDCGEWKVLDPDHIKKRSQGGTHTKGNIKWRCRVCHNRLDNMPNSKKQKGKKAEWMKPHRCKSCKHTTSQFICGNCGEKSI